MKTALATKKLRLGPTVTPVGVATLIAPLGSVPGVYSDDLAADSFSLILKESLELGKTPGVEPSFSFPTRGFDSLADLESALKRAGYRFKPLNEYKLYRIQFSWLEEPVAKYY